MAMRRREVLLGGVAMAAGGAFPPAARAAWAGRRAGALALALSGFTADLDELEHPEGVASAPNGELYFSTGKAALGIRRVDGTIDHVGNPLAPAGVAVDPRGRVLVANVGLLNGGPGPLQRIVPVARTVETLVAELEGRALVASNCPAAARDGTVYCSHSSWGPVANIGRTGPSGFIYRVTADDKADIVARELRGVNGLCLDAGDRYLYAALTAEGRIVRFPRRPGGTLGPRENYGPVLGDVFADQEVSAIRAMPAEGRARLGYCDGIAFDMLGNLWITLPFANALVAITPRGKLVRIADDIAGRALSMPTNLCWSGADRRDLHVVSRGSGTIQHVRTNVAGLPTANWPL